MIFRFGDYALDAENFELSQDGQPVAVEPQVFSLLVLLIENRHRVVTKDELVETVWDGRIVSEATLSSRISAARRAVGDTGDAQAVIRTLSRRGFRFIGDVSLDLAAPPAAAAGATEPVPTGVPNMPSLAVLPFRNISMKAGDEYFSDGLTEDIITELSRFRDLRVIGSNSTLQYKGRHADLARVGIELSARYLVEGSVRRAGNQLRISAQLFDAATGVALWADRYDREMEDIFAVQDEVTRTVAAALGVRVHDAAMERALRKSPAELDAYDCILRARAFRTQLNQASHAEARDLLEKAIALDPGSADAHALLANVYLAEHRMELNPRPDAVGRALSMAEKAVRLDPQNAYAHCWLAIVHFFRSENELFEAEAARALSLNPNDPETLADIGHYLSFMGEFARGTELTRRAQQLNPLHPGWYFFSYARQHYDAREYRDVLADVERIAMPDFYWTQLMDTAARGQLGDPGAANTVARLLELKPGFDAVAELRKWNAAPDDQAHILEGLKKAGLCA